MSKGDRDSALHAEPADLRLLKMAAKAAHLDINFEDYTDPGNWFANGYDDNGDIDNWWNPLRDSGDAFRLAVQLKMSIHIDDSITDVIHPDDSGTVEAHLGDACAATRRAIVRAAAAIGEAMP